MSEPITDAKAAAAASDAAKPKTEARAKPELKAAPAPAKPERFIAASESRFATSVEFTFPMVSYIPEAGTPLEHVLRPEYWASIRQLKAGCRVWVFAEDEAYYAELLVRKVGQGFAKMQLLRSGELDAASADPALTDGYDIQYRGPVVKHRVVRLKDGHVLKQGLDTFEDASAWLRDHKRMLAA